MAILLNPKTWIAALVAVFLIVFAAFAYRTGGASARTELADYKAVQAEQRLLADRARTLATTKALNDAHAQTVAADAAAASAADAAGRLRNQLAKYTKPARPGQGQQGSDPLDLLAGMLARHSDELTEVGRYADRLRIAGLACERISDPEMK